MRKPSRREMIASVAGELECRLKHAFDDTENLEQAKWVVHNVLLHMSKQVIKDDGHYMLGIFNIASD